MEEEIIKKVEEVISLLNNRYPKYFFNVIPPDFIDFELQYEGYKGSVSFKNNFGRKVDNLIFELKKNLIFNKISKEYLKLLIDELSMTISTYEQKDIRGKQFYFQSEALIPVYNGEMLYCTIEEVDKYSFDELVTVSQSRYDYTQKLIDGLKEILLIASQNDETDQSDTLPLTEVPKLELNISVPDIALLFRLLDEEGLINYKHKAQIFRYISTTIKSLHQDNISVDSVKNKFHTPDNTAIKNIDALLVNLRQKLKKIQ